MSLAPERLTGAWSARHQPNSATQATCSAPAVTGAKNVCTSLSFQVTTLGTNPTAADLLIHLRDGATGAGTILRTWLIRVPASANANLALVDIGGLWIEGSTGTAMTLETSAAPGTNVQACVGMSGALCGAG